MKKLIAAIVLSFTVTCLGQGIVRSPGTTNTPSAWTNAIADALVGKTIPLFEADFAGSSNVTHISWYGDSIVAGVGAGSINSLPDKASTLGAPWLFTTQTNVTRIKDAVSYTHYTGAWPGDNSTVIVDAAVDNTNSGNRNSLSVLWLGHNDFSQNIGEAFPATATTNQIANNYLRFLNWLGHSNYLVLPTLGDTNWVIGTVAYQNLTNFNSWVSNYFAPSGHFVDYLPDFMRQAVDATDRAQTNMGTAPWRYFNGPIHPYDSGHQVISTNVYKAIASLMSKKPVTVATVLEMQNKFVDPAYGSLTWVTPTYAPSWTLYNGANMNFGGSMSGAALYGINGSIDAMKAPIGSGTYSIHRLPRGMWTNVAITLTISTDCDVLGPGGSFIVYGTTMTQNTNTLLYDEIATTVATVSNIKSNTWTQATINGYYANTFASRQFRLYVKSLSNGNLTNNVFISDANWRGYNY